MNIKIYTVSVEDLGDSENNAAENVMWNVAYHSLEKAKLVVVEDMLDQREAQEEDAALPMIDWVKSDQRTNTISLTDDTITDQRWTIMETDLI